MAVTVLIMPGESMEAQCAARALGRAGVSTTVSPSPHVDVVLVFEAPGVRPSYNPGALVRPECPVLLVSRRLDPIAQEMAGDIGAVGLVSWTTPTTALVDAIESLVRGEAVRPTPAIDEVDPVQTLTARERQIVDLLGQGATNAAIAKALDISYHTVRTHVAHVLAKLGVSHRYAAAALARQSARSGTPAGGREAAVS